MKRVFWVLITLVTLASLLNYVYNGPDLSSMNLPRIDLVQVNKSQGKMYLLSKDHIVKTFDVALGGNPQGHKQQEGDQKTPEGRYTLDYAKEDSAFYRAMHVSYPNRSDRLNAQNRKVDPGGAIMVHGQKNWFGGLSWITQSFNWTNGCIALSNTDMDEFIYRVRVGTEILIE